MTPPDAGTPPWRPGAAHAADDRLAAFIGPNWGRRYRRKLAPFLEDPSFVPTWNWAAALAMPIWFLYRKLYLPFALFFFLPGVLVRLITGSDAPATLQEMQKPENAYFLLVNAGVYLSAVIAAGGVANWLLFRRAQAALALLAAHPVPAEEEAALLARWGGVNRLATWLFVAMSFVLTLAQLSA